MKISLRVRNMIVSAIVALCTLAAVLTFYNYFVFPIEQFETEKFLEQCDLEGVTCTVDPNFAIPLILGIIPFMIYMLVYSTLQNKNKPEQPWRSYK